MNMTFEQIYNQMAWTRNPEKVEVKGEVIAVTTKPHTDLWQRTRIPISGNGHTTTSAMTMRLSCR